ncbi:MAG: PEP-CTERM sorting domain-containing protein [Candidatus Pacebacteria bacterium]|nr:PEP-CTERM sorting domain-containing protein [Candidatus Paceibacterota bacterium]
MSIDTSVDRCSVNENQGKKGEETMKTQLQEKTNGKLVNALLVGFAVMMCAGSAFGATLLFSEDFEGMTVGAAIGDQTGWTEGGDGYASGTIVDGNYLRMSGGYPKGASYWDYVRRDVSGLGSNAVTLQYSVDTGNNLVAGQYYGRRVQWGIDDASGDPLVQVAMLDFDSNLTFNGEDYSGLLSGAGSTYVFDINFSTDTVQLTRNGTVIGTEALLGGDRSIADVSALLFETNGYFTSTTRTVRLDADNIRLSVIPEPASLALVGFGGLLLLRRRRR